MTNMIHDLFLRHNYIQVPEANQNKPAKRTELATVLMNLSYYGMALNTEAYKAVQKLSTKELSSWWSEIEPVLKSITGDDRNIGDFVVYKNFPQEVLDKSQSEYWFAQILMYWGLPNELFTTEVKPREKMAEQPALTVLKKTNTNTAKDIYNSYLNAPARWKNTELKDVLFLSGTLPTNFGSIKFKENLVQLCSAKMKAQEQIKVNTGTDVLRLMAGLSNADVSLREKVRFRSFKKPERRYLLNILEKCNNLEEDFARRKEIWKRALHNLHAGDFKTQGQRKKQLKYKNVCAAQNKLYNNELVTFNSRIEQLLLNSNKEALNLLQTRPGDFSRRLVHTLDVFGMSARKAFIADGVMDKLTTAQIVRISKVLQNVNTRSTRIFTPRGQWSKAQIHEPRVIDKNHVKAIVKACDTILAERLPGIKNLDHNTAMIKLPNNAEEGMFTRGTTFPIPQSTEFIRTCSYWKQKSRYGNVWFDNGWNFFDLNWKPVGTCSWDNSSFPWYSKNKEAAAIFSGDPTNSKEMQGRAAQLIDLYPKKLLKEGVRYCVWSILCYSGITFSQAEDVFAALQWGEQAQTGNLFEPSRCQINMPLKGEQKTKFICMIDLEKMEMIYLDVGLNGSTTSASRNEKTLSKIMPAFVDYLNSLPSVYDLFKNSIDKDSEISVLYTDKDVDLNSEQAYVFKPQNESNKYKNFDINKLL